MLKKKVHSTFIKLYSNRAPFPCHFLRIDTCVNTVLNNLSSHVWFFVVVVFLATPCGTRDFSSQPGIKPMSPEVKHRVLTTGPPGKSQFSCVINFIY